MSYLLELNDTELPLYCDAELIHRSPAVAIVRNQGIVFGDRALRISRSHPQQTNQQYFSRLNADPLPNPVANAANHADLVYLHLLELKPMINGELILAVPGLWDANQLGVLLGILQEVGIVVGGFVDSAVVAATTTSLPPEAHYLDIHLQGASITALTIGDDVRQRGTEEVTTCGYAGLLDGWVNVIADHFVQDTRFDPLHSASTEQQLYDQVDEWVKGEIGNEINVEIVHEDHVRRTELPVTLLADKAQQRFKGLTDVLPGGAHVLLSARSATLPGLAAGLNDAGYTTSVTGNEAIASGCANHIDQIRSPEAELKMITRLPYSRESTVVIAKPDSRTPPPTHILTGNQAIALESRNTPLAFQLDDRRVWLNAQEGVLINGQPLTTEIQLSTGDEIVHGERVYRLIVVEE